jgi:hypothetical protein
MAFVSLHIVASGYSRRSRRLAGVIASPTHDNTHPLSVEAYEGRFNLAYSFPRLLFEVRSWAGQNQGCTCGSQVRIRMAFAR